MEYLSFKKIVACGGSWMVPADAVAAKDWNRITELTRSAVNLMLGLELRHVGVNSGSPRGCHAGCAAVLIKLLGWQVKEGNSSVFAGNAFEMMKKPFRGTNGHIAIACNDIARAKWHMERRGFAFEDESTASMKDGKMVAIYLKDEIGGFAIHLLQK